ncbi:hypothetical protein [Phaeacidiphilus oryzae]|uniref:hypothetical protein n=1 Tax=Phaeacidiphilus oryzae TaxID=348818 RepID=UPI00056C24F6|nr:hypothetical protein [Phaeacidiphilus oryzae]
MTSRRPAHGVAEFAAVLVALTALLLAAPPAAAAPAGPGPSSPAPGATAVPSPSPGPSPNPHPAPEPNKSRPAPPAGGGLAPPASPNPQPGGSDPFDIPGQIKAAITGFLADLLASSITPILNTVVRLLLAAPDPTVLPRVRELWDGLRLLACSLYGLLVLAAAVLAMGHGTIQQRYPLRELLPRLAWGMLAANLSLLLTHQAITLANAIAQAVFGDGITPDDLAGTLVGLVTNVNSTTAPLYAVALGLIVAALGLALALTLVVRIAVLTVLVVAAPLALACHATPGTEPVARMWWRAFTAVLAIQIMQAIVFLTAVKVTLDPANYPLYGEPNAASLVNLLVLGACLYLLLKIPAWTRSLITNPIHQTLGNPRGSLHLLRKVALGMLLGPFGVYGLGAQLAGRAGMSGGLLGFTGRRRAGSGRARGPGRGPQRPGPGGSPPSGGGPRSPGGPAGGPNSPAVPGGSGSTGNPTAAPGGGGPAGPAPGTAPSSSGPGAAPGGGPVPASPPRGAPSSPASGGAKRRGRSPGTRTGPSADGPGRSTSAPSSPPSPSGVPPQPGLPGTRPTPDPDAPTGTAGTPAGGSAPPHPTPGSPPVPPTTGSPPAPRPRPVRLRPPMDDDASEPPRPYRHQTAHPASTRRKKRKRS